ncbi:SDR family oxidoreductase [Flavobacterium sp.]|uniref:SDR family NAD(P)-dependent oxidoreductase n=1 Tax=Flavobacterium sp. TaxID=239 RepID=UPI00286AA66C|nr:SDR family oxidoreductase [Flavobacterium sp.]
MTQNKIALVTGGSRGLGKDMALALSKKNIDVILTYNANKAAADEVVATIKANGQKAVALPFDVGAISSYPSFLNQVLNTLQENWNTNKFDFLINNAGVGATIPMADVTEEVFDNLMNIHYKGVYFLTQKSLNHINDNGGVIFISSGTTRFCVPGYSVYSSLKGAVEVLTKYVAKEYGHRGIRCNIVAPGPIETDFNGATIRNNPQMKTFLSGLSPLGRVGNADDIGSVVAFLCTDDAKWINGQRVEVSGGINI